VFFGDPYGTRIRISASAIFLNLPQFAPIQHLVKNWIWQIAADNGRLRGTFCCALLCILRLLKSLEQQGGTEGTPWKSVKLWRKKGRKSCNRGVSPLTRQNVFS